jgi:hypothetical protein
MSALAVGGVDRELERVLEDADLMDAADALVKHGYGSLKSVRKMHDEDVDKLGLPRGAAMELKEMLATLQRQEWPADARQADEHLDLVFAPLSYYPLPFVLVCSHLNSSMLV